MPSIRRAEQTDLISNKLIDEPKSIFKQFVCKPNGRNDQASHEKNEYLPNRQKGLKFFINGKKEENCQAPN